MPAQDTHIGRSTPLGPLVVEVRTLRGFAALTRGYRVVRPLRGRQHRRMPIQMWYEDRGTTATCCGTTSLPRLCRGMATGTTAPRGPNYSVTAGEHCEPADGEPHIYMYGPKGVERAYGYVWPGDDRARRYLLNPSKRIPYLPLLGHTPERKKTIPHENPSSYGVLFDSLYS